MRRLFKRIMLFCTLMVSLLVVAERNPLYDLFEIHGKPKTKFFLIIDVSLSMKDYFNAVIDACKMIARTFATDTFYACDTVFIYEFADMPKLLCIKPFNAIRGDDFPDKPFGYKTDIGKALELLLQDMKSGDQLINVVFFLTDGREDPPEYSEFYPVGSEEWRVAWKQLKDGYNTVLERSELLCYGVGLTKYADIQILQRIFSGDRVELLHSEPLALREKVERITSRIKERWLKSAVSKELHDGYIQFCHVGSKIAKDTVYELYRIDSKYKVLPVHLYISEFAFSTWEGNILKPETLYIGPNRISKTFMVYYLKYKPPIWSRLGRKVYTYRDSGKFLVTAAFEHGSYIRELGITPYVECRQSRQVMEYQIVIGIPWMFVIIVIGFIVTFMPLTRKWLILPKPKLFGRVTWSGGTIRLDELNADKLYFYFDSSNKLRCDRIRQPNTVFMLKVQRSDGFDMITVESPVYRGEITSGIFDITIDGQTITFYDMQKKRSPQRQWSKWTTFFVIFIIIGIFTFKYSRW